MTVHEIYNSQDINDEAILQERLEQRDWIGLVGALCTMLRGNEELLFNSSSLEVKDCECCWQRKVILEFINYLETDQIKTTFVKKICRSILLFVGQGFKDEYDDDDDDERLLRLDLRPDFQSIVQDECRITIIRFMNIFVGSSEKSNEIQSRNDAIAIDQAIRFISSVSFDDSFSRLNLDLDDEITQNFWNKLLGVSNSLAVTRCSSMASPTVYEPTLVVLPPKEEESTRSGDNSKATADHVENIVVAGDFISNHIFKGATVLSNGLANVVVPNVTKGIEALGDFMMSNHHSSHTDDSSPPTVSKQNETVTKEDLTEWVNITDRSVQTTDSLRRGVRSLAYGIRDVSTRQIHNATKVWKEKEMGKQLIPDDEIRETLVTTGKVAVATVGASALLVESMYHTTKAVAQTSVHVASKVGAHYHGEEVGKVIQNVGDTTGNVLRTVAHVGMLEAQVLSKVVARNSAKVEMKEASVANKSLDGLEDDDERVLNDHDLEVTEEEQHLRDFMNQTKDVVKNYGERLPVVFMDNLKLDGIVKDLKDKAASSKDIPMWNELSSVKSSIASSNSDENDITKSDGVVTSISLS